MHHPLNSEGRVLPLLSLPSLLPFFCFFPISISSSESVGLLSISFFTLQADISLEILGGELSVYLSTGEGKLSQRGFEIPCGHLILW